MTYDRGVPRWRGSRRPYSSFPLCYTPALNHSRPRGQRTYEHRGRVRVKVGKWLRVGMHVKRWLGLLLVGTTLLSLGLAMGLATVYRNYDFPDQTTTVVRTATLQFIPHPFRETLVGLLGLTVAVVALYYLGNSILSPFLTAR